jgi:hypothetical protein
LTQEEVVCELLNKIDAIENEMILLRDDRKTVLEEYKEKLDMKAFRAAMMIHKIRRKTNNDYVVDEMLVVMNGDTANV